MSAREDEMYHLRLQGVPLRAIAQEYGISRERVRQLVQRHEQKYALPLALPICRQQRKAEKQCAQRRLRAEKAQQRRMPHYYAQHPTYLPEIQLDLPLVEPFLAALGNRTVQRRQNRTTIYQKRTNTKVLRMGQKWRAAFAPHGNASLALHTWVMQQYDPLFDSKQYCIQHKDGDATNCMRENLCVLTWKELGIQNAIARGGKPRAAPKPPSRRRRLSCGEVQAIRRDYADAVSPHAIASIYGCAINTVYRVIHEKTYRHCTKESQHDNAQTQRSTPHHTF